MNLPVIVAPKGRLTEREARIAGHCSQLLLTLRTMAAKTSAGGKLQTNAGTLTLSQADTDAILALLIERNENLLIQLDIVVER